MPRVYHEIRSLILRQEHVWPLDRLVKLNQQLQDEQDAPVSRCFIKEPTIPTSSVDSNREMTGVRAFNVGEDWVVRVWRRHVGNEVLYSDRRDAMAWISRNDFPELGKIVCRVSRLVVRDVIADISKDVRRDSNV